MCPFRSKNRVANRSQGPILDVLAKARDQRAKLRFDFDGRVTSLRNLSGTLLDFDISGLTLEVSQLKSVGTAFRGVSLSCFFRIREKHGRERFFAFDSRIAKMEKRSGGLVLFYLDFPGSLRNAQMRRSVRVEIGPDQIPEFEIWPEAPDGSSAPNGASGSAAPLLGPEPTSEAGFRIENISANGLRLLVEKGFLRRTLPDAVAGKRYALRFLAVDETNGRSTTFWAKATLRYVFIDPQNAEAALGFEFLAQGVPSKAGGISWRPLSFDEIPELGRFIFRWNLELYREKGIGEG